MQPDIHTFGIAKYVYASAYDILEYENARLRKALEEIANLSTWSCLDEATGIASKALRETLEDKE